MLIRSGGNSRETEISKGATVLDAIRASGLPFSAPCGGKGTCGKCKVLVKGKDGVREVLACQTEAAQDMLVEISDASAVVELELLRLAAADHPHGVAIDIGTTTLGLELADLETDEIVAYAGRMNPQSIFGSDVISRIEAAEAGYLEMMQRLIVEALHGLIIQLCKKASLPVSGLTDITIAANTIMNHLANGLSPSSIGKSPFEPLDYFGKTIRLWQDLPPAWFAPSISGYVGGDVVAGMLSEQAHPMLLIDLGTNGEIALQAGGTSVAAATAAGPVFEGMNVRFGMPALPGAISKAAYDEASGELSLEVIGGIEARGICGSGLVDLAALLITHGLVDEGGRLLRAEESDSPLSSRLLVFEDAPAFRPLPGSEILVTQRDIRNLQLAKAAIAAGIEIVLDTAGLPLDELASLAIAGGFGQHIDKEHAADIGLIPAVLLDRTDSIGNSSLSGARKALLDPVARQRMLDIARGTNYVELSTDARFTSRFVENMGFEHD